MILLNSATAAFFATFHFRVALDILNILYVVDNQFQ